MDNIVPPGWVAARTRLLAEMQSALKAIPPRAVNLSIPKHAVTTPCLWEVTFDATLAGSSLDLRWRDGSRTNFPCGVLPRDESVVAEPQITLRLGLMSFRHPELDFLVDLYACRNRELAVLRSMAAEEAYSYTRAREILLDPALDRPMFIEVYHTGLEPMVVGFYRGVSAAIKERVQKGLARDLWIRPMFYAGKPDNKKLSTNSPGAKFENYSASKIWR